MVPGWKISTPASRITRSPHARSSARVKVPSPWSGTVSRPLDAEQLDLEHQRRVGGDFPGRPLAVAEARRDGQLAATAHPHAGHPLLPATDDLPAAQLEDQRLAAIEGAVELGPIHQPA